MTKNLAAIVLLALLAGCNTQGKTARAKECLRQGGEPFIARQGLEPGLSVLICVKRDALLDVKKYTLIGTEESFSNERTD
jgi:hypothetical protein